MRKISVIVPVYKVEQYLSRCVDSILNQSFSDFDLILVDDGSPDACPRICDEYSDKDKRVKVIHKKNGGLSDARNVGIDYVFSNADSEWITFIDSDDWVHEKYLEALYNTAVKNDCHISVCSYKETFGEEVFVNIDNLNAQVLEAEKFYISNHVGATIAWGKLYKKECFKNVRYPVGKLHEDEFLTYKILFEKERIAYINDPLYFYFQNSNGIMHTLAKKRMDAYDAMDEQIEYFSEKGYYSCARVVIRNYLLGVYSKFDKFKQEKPEKNIIDVYKERKRKCLQYIKMLDINDDADAWILMKIRPFRTQLYFYIQALNNKVKKIMK